MADRAGERAGIWTLTEKLGEGGMAEVWRGEAPDSPDVAIKLLPVVANSSETFQAEAGAVARLVHPHIIRILDFGQLSDGVMTPFLALELAEGPSLEDWLHTTPVSWNDVLDISRRVLTALAHAHSRGLVHRDIKPANLLAMDAGGKDWRLTDFGIAFTEHRDQASQTNPSGTPRYMAPEQFMARVHAQGPWTDLYSFGCVLFELLSGKAPYQARAPIQLAFQHMRDPVPLLEPRFEVPEGLAELVAVLLRKNPTARFRSAADVLRALEKLPRLARSGPSAALVASDDDSATLVTPGFEATVLLGDLDAFAWDAPDPEAPPHVDPAPPPVEPPASSPRHYFTTFHGDTGPGISSLRELPFVGRVDERRRIWAGFRRAVSLRRPQIVSVRGEAGIGKTAVGTWLTRAVDEHGFGVAVHVGQPDDPATALLHALATAYRLDRGDPPHAEEHLRLWTNADEWATTAVTRALAGEPVAEADAIRAALTVLWAQAQTRPVVLFVDDVDRDRRWADLIEHIAQDAVEAPVFVLAACTEVPAQLAEHLQDSVELLPFGIGECAELVTELVGVGVDHAYAIAKVVEGHPHFAAEVVRDWIARGLLVRSGGSWTLRGGTRPPLPDSVAAVRWQQFEAAVDGRPIDRAALEILACFSGPCPPAMWRDACAICELQPDPALEAHIMRAGLVGLRDGGLFFTDRVLQRRIVEAATQRGKQRTYHQAIATVVRRNPERWGPAALGTHLFEAGDFERSVRYLLRAMKKERLDQVEQQELLDRYQAAVEALGRNDELDGAWGDLVRARLMSRQGKAVLALQAYREVIDRARARGWGEVERDAITSWANLQSSRAPTNAHAELAARGVELADELGEEPRRIAARTAAGAMYGYLGQLDRAFECYQQAHEIAARLGDAQGRGDALYGIGWVQFLRGDLAEALGPLDQAREALRSAGNLREAAMVLSFKGDVFRALGQLDEAERAFTEAYQFISRFQVMDAAVPGNFAVLEVARGRFDDALRWARRAEALGRQQGRMPLVALAAAVELAYAAHVQDLAQWDRALENLDAVEQGDDVSYDSAYVLDAAARVAAGLLDPERVTKISERAIRHWDRLGRTAEADGLRALIAG